MAENLFSYGTLQKEKVQIALFGRILQGTRDVLEGYELSPVEIEDESFLAKGEEKYQSTLVPTKNAADHVEGTVFELFEAELLLADRYEPENYKRIRVALRSGKDAWIYVAAESVVGDQRSVSSV
ncbi:MAG: gamma-glutamylcyclotransferase family protein [Pyrinomonadaceae bacterium]